MESWFGCKISVHKNLNKNGDINGNLKHAAYPELSRRWT